MMLDTDSSCDSCGHGWEQHDGGDCLAVGWSCEIFWKEETDGGGRRMED